MPSQQPPLRPHYVHFVRSAYVASVIIALALAIGIVGYHYLNHEPWIDALLDASMILGGMGPVSQMTDTAAKLFASFYALFSGLVFIGTSAVLVAPWVHRLLHSLNAEPKPGKG